MAMSEVVTFARSIASTRFREASLRVLLKLYYIIKVGHSYLSPILPGFGFAKFFGSPPSFEI